MKRMILFSTLFLCLSLIGFTSCKKEISPTHAEQTANELNAFIQKNGVRRIYPMKVGGYFPSQFPANQGIVWSFSNGFIYMDYSGSSSVAYNLDYLVYYSILNVPLSTGTYEPALILYMETL